MSSGLTLLRRDAPLPGDTEPGGLTPEEISGFRREVYRFYRANRRDLPWRNTSDCYAILVSEMMLQQTGVERVRGRYERFLARFPDFQSLARSDLGEVLSEWQGLGYNRRAKFLHETAGIIVREHGGVMPDDERILASFPGIGKATAASLMAFAFMRPSVVIETNIRRVFLHCFFSGRESVTDREIAPLVAATCDRKNPRDWYYALMDLGSVLKIRVSNPNRRSAHYRKQPGFMGSDRMIRGKILSLLVKEKKIIEEDLASRLDPDRERVSRIIKTMEKEGILARQGGLILLPGRNHTAGD